tara:strand:+ start:360 stop:737 length:378 start_codon:yes stop_codon:yes gene_type:complete
MNWYIQGFKRYFDFSGRSRRKEYWYFALFNLIVAVLLGIFDGALGTVDAELGLGVLGAIYAVATIIPNLSITFRRLHDVNKSAWWLLILLIPLIGFIVWLVFMCQDSKDENKYGSSPKISDMQSA